MNEELFQNEFREKYCFFETVFFFWKIFFIVNENYFT